MWYYFLYVWEMCYLGTTTKGCVFIFFLDFAFMETSGIHTDLSFCNMMNARTWNPQALVGIFQWKCQMRKPESLSPQGSKLSSGIETMKKNKWDVCKELGMRKAEAFRRYEKITIKTGNNQQPRNKGRGK